MNSPRKPERQFGIVALLCRSVYLSPMKSKNPAHISLNVYCVFTYCFSDSNLIQTGGEKKWNYFTCFVKHICATGFSDAFSWFLPAQWSQWAINQHDLYMLINVIRLNKMTFSCFGYKQFMNPLKPDLRYCRHYLQQSAANLWENSCLC